MKGNQMSVSIKELEGNTQLKDLFIEFQNEILTTNDKALIANMLDKSGRLILSCKQLQTLIETALDEKVHVDVKEDPQKRSCDCCGKGKLVLQVFGTIIDIRVDDKSLEEAEPNLVKYLTKQWNISLTRTYLPRMLDFEVEKVERSTKVNIVEEEEDEEEEENSLDIN